MKWYVYVGAGLLVFLGGFLSGRRSVRPATTVSGVVVPQARDGGVPEATTQVHTGKGECTTTLTCEVKPPVIKYVRVPGTAPVECPQLECPTVVCSGTATSETPPVLVQTTQPLLPPTVVTVREIDQRRTWGIGLSGFLVDNQVSPGLAVEWSPVPWLNLQVAGSLKGGEASVLIRP